MVHNYRRELNKEELRKVQLNILNTIDAFCRTKNIKYFLAGGTLIGAIRHKGYIPWDDDIDIMLLREDYDKLINSFNDFNENIVIYDRNNYKNYPFSFAKACDIRTALIEPGNKFVLGVNVDIFPLDSASNFQDDYLKLYRKINFLKNILVLKHIGISRDRSIIKNAILLFLKPFGSIITNNFLTKKIEQLSTCIRFNTNRVASYSGANGAKDVFPRNIFDNIKEEYFEGYLFFVPCDYDVYLRQLYGDYMKLPPEDKRISHHSFCAYWK